MIQIETERVVREREHIIHALLVVYLQHISAQIAFLRSLICTGARRIPEGASTNLGPENSYLRAGGSAEREHIMHPLLVVDLQRAGDPLTCKRWTSARPLGGPARVQADAIA